VSRDERALATGLNGSPIPPALAEGEIELLGYLPRSSNETFLVRVATDADPILAVYKPRDGETPLWDFPEGTLCAREVAAYLVAAELGWPDVPPTLLRDGPRGTGSVQLFVPFDPSEHYFTLAERFADDFRRVALFDVVTNNADRKAGHCLLAEDGRIRVVDHGVCFAVEPKLRTVIWEFEGEPVPDPLRDDLRRLRGSLDGALAERLGGLLAPEELQALRTRVDRTVAAGRFPSPGGERPFPWPPI
jgi:uncharacterized repeat protein (TIGR03843 family)